MAILAGNDTIATVSRYGGGKVINGNNEILSSSSSEERQQQGSTYTFLFPPAALSKAPLKSQRIASCRFLPQKSLFCPPSFSLRNRSETDASRSHNISKKISQIFEFRQSSQVFEFPSLRVSKFPNFSNFQIPYQLSLQVLGIPKFPNPQV